MSASVEFIFGHVEGTREGQIFESREHLSQAGIHAPHMHGIWGRQDEGSCSIVLSGGYEDDVDDLDYILYTGQGGQGTPGSGKQVADQHFTKGNKGLVLSKEYGLPVRVTRGWQVELGPSEGYRYDGLYYVTKYERVRGKSGFYVCRFHLESANSLKNLEANVGSSLPAGYTSPDRTEVTSNKVKRNAKLGEQIKNMYGYRCQVCDVYLQRPNGAIAIGAHIKPLGRPANGPDDKRNMLCLCPNHHDQFDAMGFYIEPYSKAIIGLSEFEGKILKCDPKHRIDDEFLEYHKQEFLRINEG